MIDIEALVAAQNVAWLFFSGSVAALMGLLIWRHHRTRKPWEHAQFLMLGILGVSLGAFLHRLIWAVWRVLRGRDLSGPAEWIAQNAWWLTAPSVMLIIVGYIYHLRIALRVVSEKHWFWIGVTLAFNVWFWSYLLLKG